ncbi:MAG: S41 family peptidase [Patescibacteria group bacterium]|nr:S41 family peptidase [Patescibacteria group bacterium]
MDNHAEKLNQPEPATLGATPVRGQSPNVRRSYLLGAVAAFLVAGSFIGGFYLGGTRAIQASTGNEAPTIRQLINRSVAPSESAHDVDFAEFWQIWDTVKAKHISKPNDDVKMFYGAIAGMVASLQDPYSVFFDPETAKKFADELSGTFDGIGAEIGIKKNQLQVVAPLPGTPADKAGLKAGDRIHGIDDLDTTGMPVDEAVSHIRGPKGTPVKLLIGREGWAEPKEITIMRDTIKVDSVKWKTVHDGPRTIGVITITHFNEDTGDLFDQAVRSVLMENPDGIVLDLRNNPGGYLDMAVKIAGEWAMEKSIVTEKFSDGKENDYKSDGLARLAGESTVVLVNGGSASASEIVAGALQDYGLARLIGEQTFGKGSVQDYTELDDGSALKLTVALWYTPNGRSIDKDGIAPDEVIKLTPEDFDNNLDPQMKRALEWLANPTAKPATTAAEETAPAKP